MKNIITRHFTKELENSDKNVFELFKWKKVNVVLTNYSTGEVMTDMKDLEFPEDYSQSACDIIASKYFRKKGVNNERGIEYSLKQVADRMVSFWTDALLDEKLITAEQQKIVYDELVYMLLSQMWAPNSPQWFNTGLKKYGITGAKQGHLYYDPAQGKVVESEDSYTRTQGSACFIISVADSLVGKKSLTDQITNETLLFKFGSGVGTNWSTIRAKDETLSGGGKSSGFLSFLKVSDANAGAIKSGGTTRRAAKMVVLDDDHPELLEFIDFKAYEEDKVRALGKMGYSMSIDGEAYSTVTGQNANNSVRLSNNFMNKLSADDDTHTLVGRTDDSVNKNVSAKKVWNKIATAAWKCGDPGLQFDDIINDWHTCPAGEDGNYGEKYNRINASNPCSEYMFLDDTACNLASINVMKFLDTTTNNFDIEGYLNAIKYIQMVLESTIHWGQFPTEDIARKSYMFRTTGIGLTNLGMLFMSLGLPYDSDKSRHLASSLTTIMTGYSYYISSIMAKEIGTFEKYDLNKVYMKRVIRNHARVANYNENDTAFENLGYKPFVLDHNILTNLGFCNISDAVKKSWTLAIENGEKYGYRNAQVSVLAPTGTIAFAMDCASTSSEPFFSHVTYKKLVGGGFMEIVNPAIPNALKTLGYSDKEINSIVNYVLQKDENGTIVDGKIEGAPHLKEEHYSVFDTANKCGTGSRYIKPEAHVKMMSALTPAVTGAISKTVNLPNDATTKDIEDIYKLSWELGVKAIALYRDGCKATQPLNSVNEAKKGNVALEDLSYAALLEYAKKPNERAVRKKPTGIRSAKVHEANINGLKLYITTSFNSATGKLAELYVSSGRQGSTTKGLLDSISTTISEMLQYGVPAEDIAKMYRGQKYEPSGFVTGHPYIKNVDSISDLISKIIDIELGNYEHIQVKPDNSSMDYDKAVEEVLAGQYSFSDVVYTDTCPNCESTKMVQNGTCKICTVCGTTTGCS